ncbi:MAG: DUF192 domain-containing protein [Alkalinema sp. RU_4_3]|nr:DUF192 domain-containing protein [Alkalinema sp. RU_4_3]
MRSIGILISIFLAGCMAGTPTPVESAPPEQRTMAAKPAGQSLPITAEVTIGQRTIGLEVAATPLEQQIGLMARTSLADDRGMLFPFKPARGVNFWMKNTLIPLDIIYLHQGVVEEIHNASPCKSDPCPTYPSQTTIDQVIELAAGQAEALGLKVGDRLVVKPRPINK